MRSRPRRAPAPASPRSGRQIRCRPRVGRAASVVLQIVACPDGGIGLVERKLFAARTRVCPAEQAMLPGEMALERGPNLARELEVAGPHQVTDEHVHEHQVHVVVVVGNIAVEWSSFSLRVSWLLASQGPVAGSPVATGVTFCRLSQWRMLTTARSWLPSASST